MIITGSKIVEDFCKKHPDAEKALAKWVDDVTSADWKNHNDLKNSYSSADYVGNSRYIFHIKGNHYRLVVVVIFFAGTVDVRFVGTHSDYDKVNVKNI